MTWTSVKNAEKVTTDRWMNEARTFTRLGRGFAFHVVARADRRPSEIPVAFETNSNASGILERGKRSRQTAHNGFQLRAKHSHVPLDQLFRNDSIASYRVLPRISEYSSNRLRAAPLCATFDSRVCWNMRQHVCTVWNMILQISETARFVRKFTRDEHCTHARKKRILREVKIILSSWLWRRFCYARREFLLPNCNIFSALSIFVTQAKQMVNLLLV